jgi:hypothetical protein
MSGPTLNDTTHPAIRLQKLLDRRDCIAQQIAELEDRREIIQYEIAEMLHQEGRT